MTGDSKPDLIFTGDNGVLVLTNNSTPKRTRFRPSGPPDGHRDNVGEALGDIDGDGDLDIVATADTANGEVLVLANDNAADTFTESRVLVGGVAAVGAAGRHERRR